MNIRTYIHTHVHTHIHTNTHRHRLTRTFAHTYVHTNPTYVRMLVQGICPHTDITRIEVGMKILQTIHVESSLDWLAPVETIHSHHHSHNEDVMSYDSINQLRVLVKSINRTAIWEHNHRIVRAGTSLSDWSSHCSHKPNIWHYRQCNLSITDTIETRVRCPI